ncbi:23S rRNA (cytidine(2498)-2'-O)-methyltransferase RlmM [Methylococcus geothermalis]|uniref:Ribosomal RNA large subunit methyltransferase M n=1 Tax=Methylococcus geothermalis TaxID=2681310 RepID=A0A858Q592_9GAMM|nr:23S rRNA (cytidine(2498)-2'-O)-methyltransferase RlmM [Methylococcus geothermalis]QJD28998.1 23S rRNA (cytidine(2498)-2'-O)-methyltransferase RlmM [Methylococcus geothermalis]
MTSPSSILLYCRRGFEKECAAEIQAHTLAAGISGHIRAKENSAYVVFVAHEPDALGAQAARLRFDALIFARQRIFAIGPLSDLPVDDRITPLIGAAAGLQRRYSTLWLETADTNEAKELARFTRKFERPFAAAAAEAGLLGGNGSAPRLHGFFLASTAAYVGYTPPDDSSPWPCGIPRLKFPRSAPSRSTLKLEEAFLVFVDRPETMLRPGMSAVDLGAAPGGWTWQLVRRHIRTTAVDNGSLDETLMESGLVTHLRADGFRYRPSKPVDWLVCDMVEQPSRIARLVADWAADGAFRYAVFNLKLPMNKRHEEVERCRGLIEERLAGKGGFHRLRFLQLYHDREEVTGFLDLVG